MVPFARISSRYDNDQEMRLAIDAAVGRRRRSSRYANLGPFTGYRIGLDVGNGNIGWNLLFEKERLLYFITAESIAQLNAGSPRADCRIQLPELASFVPIGTFKFEARESSQKGEKSLSKIRAEVGTKSRLLDARQRRRLHVRRALQDAGLLSPDGKPEQGHTQVRADKLRVRLLNPDFVAHPHDLGRALRSLLKRRGWLKPVGRRGTDEDSGFGDGATKKYREALNAFGCKTIGEFLERCARDAKRDRKRFRKRHTSLSWQEENKRFRPRDIGVAKSYEVFRFLTPTFELIREEARLLRERQRKSVPVSDADWGTIEETAEFRRGLKAKTPGRCRYFRATEFRCVRALPGFQRFRMLEQLSHLRDTKGNALDNGAFAKGAALVSQTGKISLAELSRELSTTRLKFDKGDDEGKRNLVGAKTDIVLSEVLGESWINLPDEERDRWAMRFLRRHWTVGECTPTWIGDDEAELTRDSDAAFGLGSLDKVDRIAGKTLAEGDKFANVSIKAARILADAYAERLDYEERLAKLREAGAPEPELALYERLPYYGEVMPAQTVPAKGFAPLDRTCDEERKFGRAPNPDVHVVMNAIRKVVNEIIAMMGGILPSTCVVEVARSALSEDDANEHSKRARQREQLRQDIVAEIEKVYEGLGKRTPRGPGLDKLVDRWKAAMRQGWRDYDGSRIERSLLVDATEYQLDHVSPAAFGAFRESNLFVSRFNSQKGRRLPWEAFGQDAAFAPTLLAFATFGVEQSIEGLKSAINPKSPRPQPRGDRRKRLEAALQRAEQERQRLNDFGSPRPDVLSALRGTLTSKLESLLHGQADTDEDAQKRGAPKAFDPRDQARLFRRFHPDAKPPDGDFAARDIGNIGWSTKLALGYLRHLGADVQPARPRDVYALRCMFNIRKSDMRHDLRNHAVDAFLVAHFDGRVLRPAFDRLLGPYEGLYNLRALDVALNSRETGTGFLDQMKSNSDRLEEVLPTIATAHRADNRWNPGDAIGSGLGALGGENIYSFRPTRKEREALTAIAMKHGKNVKRGGILSRDELLALMFNGSSGNRVGDFGGLIAAEAYRRGL